MARLKITRLFYGLKKRSAVDIIPIALNFESFIATEKKVNNEDEISTYSSSILEVSDKVSGLFSSLEWLAS